MRSYNIFRERVEKGDTSTSQELELIINNIEDKKHLNVYIETDFDSARKAAKISDERFKNGNPRKLEGMVLGIKDNFSVKGFNLTCASKILEGFKPVYTATTVQRAIDEGAIVIGKLNMDEFAMGSSNETSYFGSCINPYGENLVPGGSSGGSAAAVAAGMCHVSYGSDTGGSVRQPAAFCGTFGYKPSYGVFSRFGLVSFASSLDCVGLFGADPKDIHLISNIISGKDQNDATSVGYSFDKSDNLGKRIGVLKEADIEKSSEIVKKEYNRCLKLLQENGYEIKEVDLKHSDTWIPTYYLISTSEASSNLSRYDGVRFGFRAKDIPEGQDMTTATRSQGFGEEVKKRIMLGTYSLSSGYYDAYFKKAQKSRRLISQGYQEIFNEVDFMFLPTTPTKPFGIGQKINDPIAMYLSDFYTTSANLAGIPAINIPTSFTEDNLPLGMQIQSGFHTDSKLIRLSEELSQILTDNTLLSND
ncbi:MAG: Asp-tRNA(Asn)/Glu-tRNA(Gln) amidotransferase subunit GatA [Candidatus Kapaibacteriales bacterium]